MKPLRTCTRNPACPTHALRRRLEVLEDRSVPATISIGDATATEGIDVARLIDVPIHSLTSPVDGPKSITKGPNGDYFVTTSLTSSVLRYDGSTFAYLGEFVPSGSGGLLQPIDLVFAGDRLFVSDGQGNAVRQYEAATGNSLGDLIAPGAQGIQRPTDLLVHDGALYVGAWSGDVHRYSLATGQFINKFVQTGAGGLDDPAGIQFGPDGNFYVADYHVDATAAVLRYDGTTGAFLDVFIPAHSGGLSQAGGMKFGPDGNLYIVDLFQDSVLRYRGDTGAFTDVFVSGGPLGLSGPTRLLFTGNQMLVTSQNNDKVMRFEVTPWAVFTVTLSEPVGDQVTVEFATANGTALAGSDYVATSGTLTFGPGETTRTILVQTINDALAEGTETFFVTLSNAVGATIADATGVGTIMDEGATKFYVVNDASSDRTYRYDATGDAVGDSALGSGNTAPRGAASDAAGTTVWVVDANKKVYVYNTSGGLLGSWTASGLHSQARVEGIATTGTGGYITDVWLVDARQDRVYRYANAAGRTSGSQSAASSFRLASGNSNPKGIVTDGTYLWVVNDGSTDRVFRYTLSGSLQGSWVIDPANASPTGITLDPTASPSHLWVVDSGTDRVYQYDLATSRTSGSQSASASFALAAGNTNPQGIADPPPPEMLLASVPAVLVLSSPASAALPATPLREPSIDVAAPSSAIPNVPLAAGWGWESFRHAAEPMFGLATRSGAPAASVPPGEPDASDPLAILPLPGGWRPGAEPTVAQRPDEVMAADEHPGAEPADSVFTLLADHPLAEEW